MYRHIILNICKVIYLLKVVEFQCVSQSKIFPYTLLFYHMAYINSEINEETLFQNFILAKMYCLSNQWLGIEYWSHQWYIQPHEKKWLTLTR